MKYLMPNYLHRCKVIKTVLSVLMSLVFGVGMVYADNEQTLLIINSYSENAPWSQAFTKPINMKLLNVPDVHLELVNLNSAEINDSTEYNRITDRIFNAFKSRTPEYVIMIGNFAFTMRDRIKEEWGDIPILLISRIDRYAPLEYYFAGSKGTLDWSRLPQIANIRSNYNMTAIITPDYEKECVDLMHKINPNMKKLVFMSDLTFANRVLDRNLRNYIQQEYPDMQYEWLQASDNSIHKFQSYLLNRNDKQGLLMSTWSNVNRENDDLMGMTGGNLYMISSAANPVYSVTESLLSLGAFGGVYGDLDKVSESLDYTLDRMLAGENMRTMPLFIADEGVPLINSQRMKVLGIEEKQIPEGTKYILRTPTIWETYSGVIIACGVILLLIIIGTVIYINVQRNRINLLKTHASFIKKMPWAYSKALILYNEAGRPYDIAYELNNMNAAFLTILSENLLPNMEWKIFPLHFIADKVSQLINSNAPVSFTYHFTKTDTYYEFLLCHVNQGTDRNNDKPKEVDIFANDITKRVMAQRKLRTTMRALDITINVARIIPWQWDVAQDMLYYDGLRTLHRLNPTAESDPLAKRYSIDRNTFLHNVHINDRERIERLFEDFRSGKLTHKRAEFCVTFTRNNKIRTDWVEINAVVTELDALNKPKMVLGSLLVITDRKRQEQALIAAKEKASESDRMKSAFLANMSHEIRTPLNAIVGFSSLITQTDDSEQKAKYSGIIEHNNEMLLHLVNDVLDLAKIESNTLELNIINTDLNELMRSIYDTVRLRVASGVVFNMVLGAEECYIKADPNRLSQVLINLLTNAAKFTSKGSITWGYEINAEEIEFFVRDTGIGISKENQDKLFQRFSKLNSFVQGTGLGLSICKSFVEKMGGSIGVKSRGEGKGSTFWFTLPYQPAEKATVIDIAEDTVIETPLQQVNEITLLVCEDNESNYILFESILSKHYKLLHAYNGREAIDMYKDNQPQLILMDISMPDMDGFEAVEQIRKFSATVPIIAVTAHAFATEKERILRSGFNAYIAKPINPKVLLNCVKAQLSKRFFVF